MTDRIDWSNVDYLVLNADEAVNLVQVFCDGSKGSDEGRGDTVDTLRVLSDLLPNCTAIVVTKGAHGVEAALRRGGDQIVRLQEPCGQALSKIIDTTGAGDTFTVIGMDLRTFAAACCCYRSPLTKNYLS